MDPKYKLLKGSFYHLSAKNFRLFPVYVEKEDGLHQKSPLLVNGKLLLSLEDQLYTNIPAIGFDDNWKGFLFKCLVDERVLFVWLGYSFQEFFLRPVRLAEDGEQNEDHQEAH